MLFHDVPFEARKSKEQGGCSKQQNPGKSCRQKFCLGFTLRHPVTKNCGFKMKTLDSTKLLSEFDISDKSVFFTKSLKPLVYIKLIKRMINRISD